MPLDALEQALARIGTADEVLGREKALWTRLSRGATKAVVMGCGPLGAWIADAAADAGVEIVAFADNRASLWGSIHRGAPVLSPADAVAAHDHQAYFVVGVFNGASPRRQLTALGCSRVVPFGAFFWHYSHHFHRQTGMELPHRILAAVPNVRAGYECLDDDRSRAEFAAQIEWRCTLDDRALPEADDPAQIYFAQDLVSLSPSEVFVDCGAFDGDSIRLFIDRTAGQFAAAYACEPDPGNQRAFAASMASLPEEARRRVTILPYAVSNSDGWVHFDASGSAGSRITASTNSGALESRRLDTLLRDVRPTFIKMDIEGAEPDALAGASETITKTRPILAVCAYHSCEHLWTLPVIMKALLPDYRIALRRYAEDCWETVYYAVPPERATASAWSESLRQ